jgi:hypothetical protein
MHGGVIRIQGSVQRPISTRLGLLAGSLFRLIVQVEDANDNMLV